MISVEDINWLRVNYPGMYFINNKNTLVGCLWFAMSYSPTTGKGIINPDQYPESPDSVLIEDAYEILVQFDNTFSRRFAKELGGRILHTKNKWDLGWADVHMDKYNSLCLCPGPEEELMFASGFQLSKYFYKILIPYFYYQSYLARFGREPWPSSSHEDVGILESYEKKLFNDIPAKDIYNCYKNYLSHNLLKLISNTRKIDLNMLCLCGSKNKFKECHPKGFEGFVKFHADYRSFENS